MRFSYPVPKTKLRDVAMLVAVSTALLVASPCTYGNDDLEKHASWQRPSTDEVKRQVDQWLASQQLDELTRLKVDAIWSASPLTSEDTKVLDQVAATIAAVQPATRELVQQALINQTVVLSPSFDLLKGESLAPFAKNNLRLLLGRWLAQQQLYDEAIEQLAPLQLDQVVAPDVLLFFRAVSFQRVLNKTQCLQSLEQLLENENQIPRRYEAVAQLMLADIKDVKTDSLDEISRMMEDVRRRQALNRSGTRVRGQEEEVVKKLDKLIDDLQRRQQQMAQANSGGSQTPGNPMQDSMPGGGRGAGDVETKSQGSGKNWGDLPAKDRAAALAELAKELPAHYREVIEDYFRRLAEDEPDRSQVP